MHEQSVTLDIKGASRGSLKQQADCHVWPLAAATAS